MASIEVRQITAAETRPLRQQILRPTQAASELIYDGDDAPESLHLGAFEGGEIVGIASIYRQPSSDQGRDDEWRLRGMGTVDRVRRQGVGGKLLGACVAHIAAQGGSRLWCNARVGAMDFYQAFGFETIGDIYELPDIGPHVFMHRAVSDDDVGLASER